MKLQMKREALQQLNRQVNEEVSGGGVGSSLESVEELPWAVSSVG